METPKEYRYSKEHTWLKVMNNNEAQVGITDFAQVFGFVDSDGYAGVVS